MGRTDKVPSIPPKDTNLEGYTLNDDSWEVFLFALYAADNKPQDQQAGKSANGIRWANLYEGLNSGYRARFSVLDKNELLTWAVDNQKAYDICKDVKIQMDSSEKIPDALVAKLIKLFLLLQRAEGLDVKFGKHVDESNEKVSRKDDRAKTPSTMKKTLLTKTPPSKPESRSNEGTTQRKDKLRDRVGGKTEKIESINDEPLDGPDSYVALKDFDPAVISLIQEEFEIQINTIITLFEGTKNDADSSTNSSYLALRKACKKSSDDSLWKNTVWAYLENAETLDSKELQDKIGTRIYEILNQRKEYNAFYEKETYVNVPVIENPKELREELRYYYSVLNAIKNQRVVTEDLILAVALEHIGRLAALDEENTGEMKLIIPEDASDISKYFGIAAKKLAVTLDAYKNDMKVSAPTKSPKIVRYGDWHASSIHEANLLPFIGLDLPKLLANIQSRYPMAKIQNIVSYALRRGLENGDAALRERILIQTEFKRFSDLPDEVIQRSLLQLDFENVLFKLTGEKSKVIIDDWCWKEHFDKASLLQNAKLIYPNLSTYLCPREGAILLVMHGHGTPFEVQSVEKRSFGVKTKVGLDLFTKLYASNPDSLAFPPNSIGYVAGDSLSNFEEEITSLYPDNGAKIEITKWKTRADDSVNGMYSSHDMNISWSFQNKLEPYVTLSLRDGTVLSISKSNNSMKITLSTADGLIYDFLPDKKICQRFACFESFYNGVNEAEISRVIHADGTVVRYLEDNLIQILQPNSTVITKNKDGKWIAINSEGQRTTISSIKKVKNDKVNFLNENHSEIRKRSIEREDMVSITIENNHAKVDFADGTHMKIVSRGNTSNFVDDDGNYRLQGQYSIEIAKNGYGSVSFDSEKDYESVCLPNGLTVKRGTKINGKSQENYVFLENGKFSYEVDSYGYLKVNQRTFSGKNTGYKNLLNLNWITGQFDFNDTSGNIFNISPIGEATVTKAELKSKSSAQKLNLPAGKNLTALLRGAVELPSPVPGNLPRFFMIRKDGSGAELIRDDKIVEYFKDDANGNDLEVIEEVLSEPNNAISFITIQPLIYANNLVQSIMYRQLIRYTPLSVEIRNKIIQSLSKYDSWKMEQEDNSASYIKYPVTKDKLAISSQDTSSEEYLLRFRNELEAKIMKKYLPNESLQQRQRNTLNSFPDPANKRESIWSKPRLSRFGARRSSAASDDSNISKFKKSKLIKGSKLIKDACDIPSYFDSPEGTPYAIKSSRNNKRLDRLKETDKEAIEVTELADEKVDLGFDSSNLVRESTPKPIEPDVRATLPDTIQTDENKIQTVLESKKEPKVVKEEKEPHDPLKMDIYGNPRIKKVPLPNAVKMSKPGAFPNDRFLQIEAETKRLIKTASTVPFKKKGGTFEVLPSRAKFGTLREGYVYQTIINLVNVGLDITRFRIKLPSSRRISLNYRKGPVAPGMKLTLEIMIDARHLDADQVCKISEDIVIVSESEYLHVPVTAEIYPTKSLEAGKIRPHVTIVADKTSINV